MDNKKVDQENESQTAVPYTPPPPPNGSSSNSGNQSQASRPPIVNTMIIIAVVVLSSYMLFNFVGHGLTQTAGQSTGPEDSVLSTPTPSVSLTPSPTQ